MVTHCYSILFVAIATGMYDYVFSENGLVAYKDGKLIGKEVCVIIYEIMNHIIITKGIYNK